ncbi:MAG: dihydroneopterin aldolase [Campylobacterales bacterium]|nr:dihydroneopterin aldolase [Campylobacterales bacterium]
MTIHIEALTFNAIIGLLDFERERPQRICVDMKASYTYQKGIFIDYADIAALIQKDLKEKRYKLLEDALLELKELIFAAYPSIQTLWLKIQKPDILPECSVGLSESWSNSTLKQ